MGTASELQTLEFVSSEIDESEIKITFANQCIKAQEALATKLKEEIQRRKELCNIKKNENLKLEAEIKNAEFEIQSLRVTHKTVKTMNTEMKKDLLLTKERKFQISERIKRGETKYEELWVQDKKRYESIPLVQTLMQGKMKVDILKNDIDSIENEVQSLDKAIKVKRDVLAEKDKQYVIHLAKYLIHERPVAIKTVKEKKAFLDDLTKEIENCAVDDENKIKASIVENITQSKPESDVKIIKDKWSFDETMMIPKLQLPSADMDVINFKLDINKVTLHASPVKRSVSIVDFENNVTKRTKPDEQMKDNYISCYFNKTVNIANDNKQEEKPVNYSHKKLINILEDIKLDDNETYKIVAQANIDQFQEIDVITVNRNAKDTKFKGGVLKSQDIEEIDLTNGNLQDPLVPPPQFLDISQDNALNAGIQQEVDVIVHVGAAEVPSKDRNLSQGKSSQEKKVSFDIPVTTQQDVIVIEDLENLDGNPNETSQLNISAVSDDSYIAMKDLILKKHHLDLSPQFVYAKNTMLPKKDEDEIVKSKFFESQSKVSEIEEENKGNNTKEKVVNENVKLGQEVVVNPEETDLVSMDDNAINGSEPMDTGKPITGLLFTHGPQGITGLDISMSTTGYEDGDPEFPNCLDSSLLLSPKPDLPLPMSGNDTEVTSQDMPNFLSGFRKTGLSFFKQSPSESNPESNKQTKLNQENNFSFNFGGGGSDEKKARGGLFSFFR